MDNSCPFKNKIITKAVAPPLFFILLFPFWFWLFSCSSSSVFLTSAGKQDFDELISARTWEKNSEINASSIPKIKIISKDWGNGHPKDIHEILKSVAEILFPLGGKKPYDPIWVGKSENGPIILYQRGKKGEYIINLNTQDRYWCQYAFQFSHEVGHILCNYREGNSSNLWFEETLCEVASLYSLLRLEKKWEHNPPYPQWKDYGPEFTKYAQQRMIKYQNEIPDNLERWLDDNTATLAAEPINRPRNVALAVRLLPLFDKFPEGWSACAFLNEKKSKKAKNFYSYMNEWYFSCPTKKKKEFVKKIANEFGFKLPLENDLNNN